jgi:hypothetical protein
MLYFAAQAQLHLFLVRDLFEDRPPNLLQRPITTPLQDDHSHMLPASKTLYKRQSDALFQRISTYRILNFVLYFAVSLARRERHVTSKPCNPGRSDRLFRHFPTYMISKF